MGPGSVQAEVSSEQLLERDESMSALHRLLESVQSERTGRLVWVGGEAGVGKTTLLRSFCQMRDVPTRVAWGACEPLRTPRPLGPFLDVAETIGGEFAQLVAAAARPHEVAAALLEALSGRRPTVLVLEDLHWADEATLDVISLLATRIASATALVLASYRDDELDRAPALRVVVGELARRPSRLKIEPLSAAAVATLAGPYGLDPGELHVRTGGRQHLCDEERVSGRPPV